MTRPVAAAILSFTEIDVGEHRAFNEWHRFDHMPEQFVLDGVVAAERLVATPDLAARRDAVDGSLAATQYFGFYLIAQPIHKTFRELGELAIAVQGDDRWFERRGPSGRYRLLQMYSAPNVVSDPAVMPFRPHQGVFVTVDDPKPGARQSDLATDHARHEETRVRAVLDLPGAAGCWSFEASGSLATRPQPGMVATPIRRAIRVYWLDADPGAFVDAFAALAPDERPDGQHCYSTVFSGGYRFIRPDSEFDWFDGA